MKTPGDFSTIFHDEFDEALKNGDLTISLGKVPILDVDGFQIPQSKAIERYIARTYGMMGSSDLEAALVDAFAEHVRDMKDAYTKAKAAGEQAKFFEEKLPDLLGKVAKSSTAPGPWLVGTKLSYADVVFFAFLTDFFDDKEAAKKATPPKIQAAVDAVAALPQIKKWIESRPVTPF